MTFFDLNLFFGIEDLAIVVVNVHSCVLDKHGDLFWRHILNKPNFNLTWFRFLYFFVTFQRRQATPTVCNQNALHSCSDDGSRGHVPLAGFVLCPDN